MKDSGSKSRCGESVMGLAVLVVCAVFGSLAAGVLVAYGICVGMFRIFQMHSMAAARKMQLAMSN
jgi:nitrate reductase NapE component